MATHEMQEAALRELARMVVSGSAWLRPTSEDAPLRLSPLDRLCECSPGVTAVSCPVHG